MIYFITGNEDKFEEVKAILPEVKRLAIDLPEIQEIDAKKILKKKLAAARSFQKGDYLVEDTALYLECLGGKLPGPLIKWFEEAIGNEGIVKITEKFGNRKATAKTLIGYLGKNGKPYFFEGELRGQIVFPRGNKDFGWGPIFEPSGCRRTFGQMGRAEKNKISMRRVALENLKEFLRKK